MNQLRRTFRFAFAACYLSLLTALTILPAPAQSLPQLTTEQVVSNLVRRNAERAEALRSFHALRSYSLNFRGFTVTKDSSMLVDARYDAPATKQFHIVKEDGSRLLLDRVLHKLLESEQEALTPENRDRVGLTPANYDFQLIGSEAMPSGPAYILQVEPKTHNKFLYRGRVWVDAHDFAVVRIVAQPSKNPSFWIKQSDIEHTYRKVGDFWLPEKNHTVTQVRLGGRSELTILYNDYKLTDVRPLSHNGVKAATLIDAVTPPISSIAVGR